GIAVVPAGGAGALPRGWRVMEAGHPVPDERSVAAGGPPRRPGAGGGGRGGGGPARPGGAPAPRRAPAARPGGARARAGTARTGGGGGMDEIEGVRGALSAIKAGRLALASAAPVVTLAVSDVIGDPLAVIGSGPTVGPWLASPGAPVDDGAAAIWRRARQVLA